MTAADVVANFLSGIRTLNVPRIEDLPYWSSPPIQFVYERTAALALGQYVFGGAQQALAVPRPIIQNTIYFFRNVSMSANISEADFQASIATTPVIQFYKQAENGVQLFREPLRMNQYFQQFDYRLAWQTQASNEQLLASIYGILNQTAGLIGKASITIKVTISAQEVSEPSFIRLFREQSYPVV